MNQNSVAGTLDEFIQQKQDEINAKIQERRENLPDDLKTKFELDQRNWRKYLCESATKELIEFLAFERFVAELGIEEYMVYHQKGDSYFHIHKDGCKVYLGILPNSLMHYVLTKKSFQLKNQLG